VTIKNARILIVDDQEANTVLLENFLKMNGFSEFKSLNDSRKAIEEIETYAPDLLLLDVMMPYVSGIDILNMLNIADKLNGPMRVMVLTADATKETLKQVLNSGAHDMLRKPFDFVELELRIRNLLQTNSIMKQLNDQSLHLSELVHHRTAELLNKNEELEQFIYVASHDTQEPLRMITGFLQLIEKKYSSVIDEKGKEYIHFALTGADRMKRLIKEMLDFSRADKSILIDLEDVDTSEVLEDVKAGLGRAIEQSGAQLNYENMPFVKGVSAPIRQVFHNLINNAITYQPKDQQPTINISHQQDAHEIRIYVADNGIGIAEKDQKRVFDIFTRLHRREDYDGSGLGLSLSKKLMEKMGGSISLKSELGKGCEFCLHFPK
jgi:signal transduction histidine kinase